MRTARRAQIIEAAIDTIAAEGLAATSFAKIARTAGLSSTGLISYHFASKRELMDEVARAVHEELAGFTEERMREADGPAARLRAFVAANVEFAGERHARLRAAQEIGGPDTPGRPGRAAPRGPALRRVPLLRRRPHGDGDPRGPRRRAPAGSPPTPAWTSAPTPTSSARSSSSPRAPERRRLAASVVHRLGLCADDDRQVTTGRDAGDGSAQRPRGAGHGAGTDGARPADPGDGAADARPHRRACRVTRGRVRVRRDPRRRVRQAAHARRDATTWPASPTGSRSRSARGRAWTARCWRDGSSASTT